jgi:predicted GH43/DUF377 family glycosyl hydrolase
VSVRVRRSKRIASTTTPALFRLEKERFLRNRSSTPILIPELEETTGVVNNVVFPTGIDKRSEDIFDIYYGMADKYIGVARLQLPDKVDYDEATPPAVAEH